MNLMNNWSGEHKGCPSFKDDFHIHRSYLTFHQFGLSERYERNEHDEHVEHGEHDERGEHDEQWTIQLSDPMY